VNKLRGFSAHRTLPKSYISEVPRRDEAQFDQNTARRLAAALNRRDVAAKLLREAMRELAESR